VNALSFRVYRHKRYDFPFGASLTPSLLNDLASTGRPPLARRDYEVVGYVIQGRAELHVEGQVVVLEPGNSLGRAEGSGAYVQDCGALHGHRSHEPTR
jgi:hypothetical protein